MAVLISLAVWGAFCDFEIASAVYLGETFSENPFGIIFAFIGVVPTFVGWAFLGASIFCLSKKQVKNTKQRRILIAFSIILFILSFFYFCNTVMLANGNAFPVHFAIAYPIGILTLALAAYAGYKLSAKSENERLLEKVVLLAAVSTVMLVIISSTKSIMDRPRFRWVLDMANPDYFKSFWQSGSALKESFGSATSDEFSSFPSGHSAYSMFAVFILPALADFLPRLEKFRPLFFAFGFLFWAATAFSRMTVGAHYLTDVAIGAFATFFAYTLVYVIKTAVEKHLSATKGN